MPRDTALRAYRNFFEGFNTRDPHEFSMALHYPHVRMSWRRPPAIVPDPEAHALNLSWDWLIEQGWDHTNGADPQVIHTSADKWHISGGWTRVREDDSAILTNYVTYIVTRIDELWGIQCRYGTDSEIGDQAGSVDDSWRVVEQFKSSISRGQIDGVWKTCGPVVHIIEVGAVRRVGTMEALPLKEIATANIEHIHSGSHSSTFAVTGSINSALLYLTNENGWKIQAISWV